jgi:serine/threonine-protein kinase PknK
MWGRGGVHTGPLTGDEGFGTLRAEGFGSKGKGTGGRLTPRQGEVAALVADGLTNAEIAARLAISERTVDSQLQQVYRKLGIRTRRQLKALQVSDCGPSILDATSENHLPASLTGLIGREEELLGLFELASSCRLLTLAGPGGVGKTRLALQLARTLQVRLGAEPRLVELSHIAEGDPLPDVLLAALRLRRETGQTVWETIVHGVRQQSTLLLLDSCEHVIGPAAVAVDHLLRSCPQLQVLATSREPLAVDGEQVRYVQPLQLPGRNEPLQEDSLVRYSALRLFRERAAEAGGPTIGGPADAEVVAQICRRLDGLPLAIELAAARSRTMSLPALLARLDGEDRYQVLTSGRRTGEKRHRTLRATVEWSFRLLTEDEQRLFSRLSVFATSFDLRAAQRIGGQPPVAGGGVVEILSGLVEKSFVVVRPDVAGADRYHMLDTLRAFGRERLLASGEEQSVRRWHANHYAEALAEPVLSWTGEALDAFRDQMDDVRGALSWASTTGEPELVALICRSLVGFWGRCGDLLEAREWMDDISNRWPRDDVHRGFALADCAWLAQRQGDIESAREYALEYLRIGRLVGDPRLVADGLARVGDAARNGGDHGLALRCLGEAAAIRRTEDGPLDLDHALILMRLGSVQGRRGDLDAGRRHLQEALDACASIGEGSGVAYCQGWLGELSLIEGDLRAARALLAAALRGFQDMSDAYMVAILLDLLSWLAVREREPIRALRLAGAAWSMRDTIGARRPPVLEAAVGPHLQAARRTLWPRADSVQRQGVAAGFQPAIAYALREAELPTSVVPRVPPALAALTPRERQVYPLIAEGLTDPQIAMRLHVSVRTAEHHVQQVRTKLGCATRAQVAGWAARHRLDLTST